MFEGTKNGTHHAKRWNFILLLLQLWCIHRAWSTEIFVGSWYSTQILGLQVSLPVSMECQSLPPGYQEVLWYRDGTLVAKKGGTKADQLELLPMMWNTSSKDLDVALRFQGYYWCEADNMAGTEATKYLFRIEGIHTFAGKFVATRDEETGEEKRASYEKDIQDILFGFLPTPNTHVHNVTALDTGTEVLFYLYIGKRNTWLASWSDQLALEQALDGLKRSNTRKKNWMKRRGIEQVTLRSTLGCFRSMYMVPADIPKEFRILDSGNIAYRSDVISREECSAKNRSSATCVGDIYSGFRWIDPSGRCNILPIKFNFGGVPRPIYVTNLLKLTLGTPNVPTVAFLSVLTKFTESPDLNVKEMEVAFRFINHLFDVDRMKLAVAKSTYNLTSMLLQILDNIAARASERNKEVHFTRNHMVLSVSPTFEEGDFEVISTMHIWMYALLPDVYKTDTRNVSKISVFFEYWLLFPNPGEALPFSNYRILPAPVMYLTSDGETLWNSTRPLEIYYRNEYGDAVQKSPVCVNFDRGAKDGKGGWSTGGCEYSGMKNGFFSCSCHSHSIFSILLFPRPGYKIPDFKFPEIKIKYSNKEVPHNKFNNLNLIWIIPLAMLMVLLRSIIIGWIRSWCWGNTESATCWPALEYDK